MKAAVLHKFGEAPRCEDFPNPVPADGQLLVQVVAVALEGVDKAQASGRHYSSKATFPTLPAIIGGEGIGVIDGKMVTFGGCIAPYGAMAERTLVPARYAPHFMPLAAGVDPAMAAAVPSSTLASLLPLMFGAKLQKGETVLVQGATGFAGRIAIQVARKLGAARVVGTGRDAKSLEALPGLGADAVIDLTQSGDGLRAALTRAAGDSGYDVVLDFLWGRPTEALLRTLIPETAGFATKRIRLVQIGEGAGPDISLAAAALRTSGLEIIGASAGIVPDQVPRLSAQVFEWIRNGELRAEVERIRLDDIERAWTRELHGKRLVVMPSRGSSGIEDFR